MPYNIRIVSTYPPRRCGIGTFARHLANALANFTGEVGHVRVAAIDKEGLAYNIPVDLLIDQYNPASWIKGTNDIISRARESENPTLVLLQHEYGLDPDEQGHDAKGWNFVKMAKALTDSGLTTMVYLHTVLEDPDDHQKAILQKLADHTDGLLVPTRSAVDILERGVYKIDRAKIKHIDHGIRMQSPSQYDRLTIKKSLNLDNKFLITTLGLHSPGKGLIYSIRAFGKFLKESCTEEQRKKISYVIAGGCHPEYMKHDGGKPYAEYMAQIDKAIEEAEVSHCKVTNMDGDKHGNCELVFLDTFLEESVLMKFYGATNVMLLPYLNMQQISSGILADTVGSGRVGIATKFRYAVELLAPEGCKEEGLFIDSHGRGILVDPEDNAIEQIAQALDFLVFNRNKRLAMETRTHRRGYQMRWDNTAWAILQYVQFVAEQKDIITGRGIEYVRKKESNYEKLNRQVVEKWRAQI